MRVGIRRAVADAGCIVRGRAATFGCFITSGFASAFGILVAGLTFLLLFRAFFLLVFTVVPTAGIPSTARAAARRCQLRLVVGRLRSPVIRGRVVGRGPLRYRFPRPSAAGTDQHAENK